MTPAQSHAQVDRRSCLATRMANNSYIHSLMHAKHLRKDTMLKGGRKPCPQDDHLSLTPTPSTWTNAQVASRQSRRACLEHTRTHAQVYTHTHTHLRAQVRAARLLEQHKAHLLPSPGRATPLTASEGCESGRARTLENLGRPLTRGGLRPATRAPPPPMIDINPRRVVDEGSRSVSEGDQLPFREERLANACCDSMRRAASTKQHGGGQGCSMPTKALCTPAAHDETQGWLTAYSVSALSMLEGGRAESSSQGALAEAVCNVGPLSLALKLRLARPGAEQRWASARR